MKRAFKIAGIALGSGVLLVAVAGAWLAWSPRRVPEGQPSLTTLDANSLPEFRHAFNDGHGEVRIVALLSPT